MLLLLACTDPAPPASDAFTLAPAWRDADNRALLHRGFNVSNRSKTTADLLTGWSDDTLALLPAHGVTLARYLVFWQGLEPERGVYDEAYLDGVAGEVARLHDLGVDVMIDLHQDVWGEGFGYTGFPRWTCDEANYTSFVPNPEGWYLDYLSDEVSGCFDSFWASAELQDAYAAAAAHLAARLGDSVVGFETINEPWFGSQEDFETGALATFHQRVADAVRAESPDAWIAVEPSVATNLTGESDLVVPDGDRVLFTPHFYPVGIENSTSWEGDLDVDWIDGLAELAADRGVPLWISEFGATADDAGMVSYAQAVLDAVEADQGSTAYWAFDPGYVLTDEVTPGPMLDAWTRPFPFAVPGNILGIDRTAAGFTLRWDDPDGKTPAIFVVPEAGCASPTVDGEPVGTGRVEVYGEAGENERTLRCG